MIRTLCARFAVVLLAAMSLSVAIAASAFAQAVEKVEEADRIVEEIRQQTTFCEGTYALCIKAPCTPIPTLPRLANYTTDHALCSCNVVRGWSMGPGACEDRAPVTQGGRTYLISTYSNRYNKEDKTLSCGRGTVWAWCYGAPCVVDEKDPTKAVCTCPVMTGRAQTLGGDCQPDACEVIWSAATPAGILFANNHFYNTMRKDHPDVPVHKPAKSCGVAGNSGDAGG